jgi:hypothetical protein
MHKLSCFVVLIFSFACIREQRLDSALASTLTMVRLQQIDTIVELRISSFHRLSEQTLSWKGTVDSTVEPFEIR